MHPHYGGVCAGAADGVGHDHVVILFPHPAAGTEIRGGEKGHEIVARVLADRNIGQRRGGRRWNPRAVVFGGGTGQSGEGEVGFDFAIVDDQEAILGDGFADDGEVEVPFVENRLRLGLQLWL